jgi:uncharacterized protein (DUF697 family)
MIIDALKILREVDLQRIAAQSEARFCVLLIGEADWAEALARALGGSSPGEAHHPWLIPGAELPEAAAGDPGTVIAIDASLLAAPAAHDVELQRHLVRLGATIISLVPHDATSSDISAARAAGAVATANVPRGASAGATIRELAPVLLETAGRARDDLDLALARALPPLRRPYVSALVESVARTNAAYAATTGAAAFVPGLGVPLAAGDMIILTKNQLIMSYRIALAAGKSGDPKEIIAEIAGVVGGGFLFRQIARELVGLIPVIGLPTKIVIAYAGTRIVGEMVRQWALEGRRLTRREIRATYVSAIAAGRSFGATLHQRSGRGRRRRLRPAPAAGRLPALTRQQESTTSQPPREPPQI